MKFFFFISMVICSVLSVHAQNTAVLKQEHVAYGAKNFYISDVADSRNDKGYIGSVKGGAHSGLINFQNGAASALKGFIADNVTQNKNTQAIVLQITKLNFNIAKSGDEWDEEAEIVLTFYANGKNLVEYSGKGTKKTDADPMDFVDEFVRKAIESDFKRFDSWWEVNKDKIALSSNIKVNATLGRIPKKPENIVYSLERPLRINDFNGTPEGNIVELAATLSGTGLETSGEVVDGQLVLSVLVTPYFNRSGSWFKQEGNTQQVLAHEQAHFDITAINACELLSKIKNTSFTEQNYEQKLQELMKWNTDATDQEQATYDAETNHGVIRDKQLEWQKKISEQVRACGCY